MRCFHFLNNKKETNTKDCVCHQTNEMSELQASLTEDTGIVQIQVLGTGCKNCHTLFENTKEAVRQINLAAEVEYVTDMQRILESGIMSMPALLVNGRVVSAGRVLKTADIVQQLQQGNLKDKTPD